MKRKLGMLIFCLFSLSVLMAGCGVNRASVDTQNKFPTKPITLIVQYSPGGSTDLLARSMEKIAKKYLNTPLVVVNKPGGGGTIAWNELIESKPDGYTLGMATNGVILQPLYGSTRYNYPTALEPIAQIAISPVVLAVRADSPWQTLEEVINYAKQHPGEIKFGHPGLGSGTHIVGEMFAKEAGIQIAQVPFLGTAEAVAATLGGHIHLVFASTPADIKELVKTGKLRALAISGEKRLTQSEFAGAPTFQEKGINVVLTSWNGVAAPKEMPDNVKDTLAQAFKKIVNDPEFIHNIENLGMTVEYLDPKATTDKWILENNKISKFVQETGIAERIAAQKK
jgi:tripartite-type tricarboxylate transporter receptor subunit TctC